jgi:hypothetical protein
VLLCIFFVLLLLFLFHGLYFCFELQHHTAALPHSVAVCLSNLHFASNSLLLSLLLAKMKIRFMHNNSSYDLEDDGSTTIQVLKEQLSKDISSEQLSPNNQKWIYKGKVLLDVNTLLTSGFTDGDTIHVLQTAIATEAAPPTVSQSQITPTYFPVPQFDHAMGSYLSMHSSPADISPSLSTILKIISNIIKNPYEEKYRKIKSTNNLIQKKIVSVPGALNVLLATGFAPVGEEYVMTISPSAWEVLVACQRKLDEFLKKLEQSTPESGAAGASGLPEPPAKKSALSVPPAPSAATAAPLVPPSSFPLASSSGVGQEQEQQQQQQAMQQFLLALAATTGGSTAPTTASSEEVYLMFNVNMLADVLCSQRLFIKILIFHFVISQQQDEKMDVTKATEEES